MEERFRDGVEYALVDVVLADVNASYQSCLLAFCLKNGDYYTFFNGHLCKDRALTAL